MKTIRLSRKVAAALLVHCIDEREERGPHAWAISALREALKASPKKDLVKHLPKPVEGDVTEKVRAEVLARSRGCCEACAEPFTELQPFEMDHFFGRAKAAQKASNCWGLCRICHREKTHNRPNAAHWLSLFVRHCERHGYRAEKRRAQDRLYVVSTTRAPPMPRSLT